MTQLLEQAVSQLQRLPDSEQNTMAQIILEELADNERWDASFESSQDVLARLANAVRADITANKTRTMGFDEL